MKLRHPKLWQAALSLLKTPAHRMLLQRTQASSRCAALHACRRLLGRNLVDSLIMGGELDTIRLIEYICIQPAPKHKWLPAEKQQRWLMSTRTSSDTWSRDHPRQDSLSKAPCYEHFQHVYQAPQAITRLPITTGISC